MPHKISKTPINPVAEPNVDAMPVASSPRSATIKSGLHPRNKHRERYRFDELIATSPALKKFVRLNAYQDASIDFADPRAVKALNQALLQHFYAISGWDIPPEYLCPPIPGRADHIHYLSDLPGIRHIAGKATRKPVRVLDIGVGANAIYPLIGFREYGWHFVGSDIDETALANAQRILNANRGLTSCIELRLQNSASAVFNGVVRAHESFDLTMCNPPFHQSFREAQAATQRKLKGLSKNTGKELRYDEWQTATHNFGGHAHELYCDGGEVAFIERMVAESRRFATQCLWFTTLVSQAAHLPDVYRALQKVEALRVETIDMSQGQKKGRIVAWTFRQLSIDR